ncbi:MAG TPA: PAS domain S-box protein [Drouetiella sp.]
MDSTTEGHAKNSSNLDNLRQSEVETSQDEYRLRLLSNTLPLSIIHTNKDGLAVYVNKKWERLSGLTGRQSLGTGWQAAIHEKYREQLMHDWREYTAAGNDAFSADVRLASPDDAIVWLSATVTSLGDAGGIHNGFVWTFEDISKRVLAEQNILTQLEVTRSISEATTLEDAGGNIVSAICNNLGWQGGVFWDLRSRDNDVLTIAIVSMDDDLNCEALVHKLSATFDDLMIKQTLRTGEPVWSMTSKEDDSDRKQVLIDHNVTCRLTLPVVTSKHVVGLIELFGTSINHPNPESQKMIFGLAKQIAEFAERVAAQTQLSESIGKLKEMVKCAVDGIITIDTSGVVESFNPAFSRIFGYEPFKLIGNSAGCLLPDELTLADFLELLASAEGAPREMVLKTKNGTLLPVEISVGKIGGDKVLFYTVIVRDVSERKEVERRVSEFYSTVSHELRTPLTSIRGSLGLIEGGIVGEVSPDVLELVTIARGNSDRLIRLINDILDMRKIEAGKLELRLAETRVIPLVARTLAEIKGFADEKSISMTSEILIDATILVDQDRIIQVLTNLLSNAIKFSEPGETVKVVVSKTASEAIRFAIIDNGEGIAEGDMGKLFGKFQQLDSSDSRAKEGTGLGLAISKAIVEAHGGTIGVTSVVGEGCEFWFELDCLSHDGLAAADHFPQSFLMGQS